MTALLALQIAIGAVAVFVLIEFARVTAERRRLRLAGAGVGEIDRIAGDTRRVDAEVVAIPSIRHAWDSAAIVDVPYTIVSVPHSGNVERPAEYVGPDSVNIDRRALGIDDHSDPLRLDELAFIRGTVRIERDRVRFIEQGDLLEPGYLRAATSAVIRLANQVENDAAVGAVA